MVKLLLESTKHECILNNNILNGLDEIQLKVYLNTKKIIVNLAQTEEIDKFIELFKLNNVDFKGKPFVINISNCENGYPTPKQGYLTTEQCKSLFNAREKLKEIGAELKVEDGKLWDLEDVLVASSKIEEVVNKIQSAVVKENGENRPLNELEKFLWIYKFVTNRLYKDNGDVYDTRAMTSILNGEEIVCAGFANLLKEMCLRVGIECHLNNCLSNGRAHANNVVVLNNVPYFCDSCFDCKKTIDTSPWINHCLIPCSDVKYLKSDEISYCKAPFFNLKKDLKTFKQELKEIESKHELSFDEYLQFEKSEYSIYGNSLRDNYFNLVPSYTADDNLKNKACYYLREIIKLLEERSGNNIFSTDEIETALKNMYVAQGNNINEAQRLASKDVDFAISAAYIIYDEAAENCFANESYKLYSSTL